MSDTASSVMGKEWKGPAILPNCISLVRFQETTSGCWEADIKLCDTWEFLGAEVTNASNVPESVN